MDYKSHWNKAFEKEDHQLGWFEEFPEKTLELISVCELPQHAKILNVGAGTTTLIDGLLEAGYSNIIANDLSPAALGKLKVRIKESYQYNLHCIADDLTNPKALLNTKPIDLWIDRAVLHFFLKPEEQDAYFKLIQDVVTKNGYVLIAVFALGGAKKCCGLDLHRYNTKMLHQKLGTDFELIKAFNHTYINPFGDERPYIYTLFKRIA